MRVHRAQSRRKSTCELIPDGRKPRKKVFLVGCLVPVVEVIQELRCLAVEIPKKVAGICEGGYSGHRQKDRGKRQNDSHPVEFSRGIAGIPTSTAFGRTAILANATA